MTDFSILLLFIFLNSPLVVFIFLCFEPVHNYDESTNGHSEFKSVATLYSVTNRSRNINTASGQSNSMTATATTSDLSMLSSQRRLKKKKPTRSKINQKPKLPRKPAKKNSPKIDYTPKRSTSRNFNNSQINSQTLQTFENNAVTGQPPTSVADQVRQAELMKRLLVEDRARLKKRCDDARAAAAQDRRHSTCTEVKELASDQEFFPKSVNLHPNKFT